MELITSFIKQRPYLELIDDFHFTYEQWQGNVLKPLEIEDFIIVPPWLNVEAEKGKRKLLLDPGVVFGTGLHPTTKDCLRAMTMICKDTRFERVLDLGTGTGILAVAAAGLGAKKVLGVDLNPLCIKTAKKNVAVNQQGEVIEIVEGDALDFADERADLVLANIQFEVLSKLLLDERFILSKNFVFSGLMRTQARDIKDRLAALGLKVIKEWDHEMTWYTILVKN